MKKRRWLRFGLAGLALAFAGFLLAASGVIPLGASGGHWRITEWLLRFGMKRSIATHSLGIKAPDLRDPSLVLQGAMHYHIGCRSCHGEPGMPRPRVAAHMLPVPPELAPRVRESTPERLFYVVKHGMKFTGMPAWPTEHRDDEVWAMVAFLLTWPNLDSAGYNRLVNGSPSPTTPSEDPAFPARVPIAVVQSCARCHGGDGMGRGDGASPAIMGQRRDYLKNALEAYAQGRRHSGTMETIAAGLAPDMIEALVLHYAGQPAAAQEADATAAAGTVARGRTIALDGIRDQRVPACIECHGPGAKRGKPSYPSLAGQSARYLERQLKLFKEERRGGSEYAHLMRPVASRLTPEQMSDVARYFESLAPNAPPGHVPSR